jgi:hypothetical protein
MPNSVMKRPPPPCCTRAAKGITVGIQAEPGTNVLELTDNVEVVVQR